MVRERRPQSAQAHTLSHTVTLAVTYYSVTYSVTHLKQCLDECLGRQTAWQGKLTVRRAIQSATLGALVRHTSTSGRIDAMSTLSVPPRNGFKARVSCAGKGEDSIVVF